MKNTLDIFDTDLDAIAFWIDKDEAKIISATIIKEPEENEKGEKENAS